MPAVAFFVCLCAAVGPVSAQSWVAVTAPSNNIGPIACSADGTNLVLAGGGWFYQGGVPYVSHDSGATWTAANVPVALWDAVASSADGTTLLAREFFGALYTSSDSGATWKLNDLTNVSTAVTCSADGTRLFALASLTNRSLDAIYASTDSGATWAPAAAPAGVWEQLACSADGTKVVAGEGANVWVSTNSGAAFWLAYTLAPPYIAAGDQTTCASVACSADGARMAAGSYAGYYYPWAGVATSGDSGATWAFSTNGVALAEYIWRLAYSADGSRMAALGGGVGPVGGIPLSELFLSGDSGATWDLAPPGVAAWTGVAMSADGCKLTGVSVGGLFPDFTALVAGLQTTPAPLLGITGSSGGLALSWTVPSMSFVLQQNPSPATTNWTDVPGTPALDYSMLRNRVTVPAPAGQMFYRLISQ